MNILYKTWNLWSPEQQEIILKKTKENLGEAEPDLSAETVLDEAIRTVNQLYWVNFINDTICIEGLFSRPCTISGIVENKDGKHNFAPEKVSNLIEAINKIIFYRDYKDCIVYEDENGDLLINVRHSNGTNKFKITYADGSPINWRDQVWGRRLKGEII